MSLQTDPTTQAAILALIPGSIEPGVWTVRPIQDSTGACTYLDERRADLPLGTLPEDRMVLHHEQGHIRWDLPSDKLLTAFPAIAMPYVAEFYRMLREWVIDARLTAANLDIRPSANLLDWTAQPDPQGKPLDTIARMWIQWYYRSLHPDVVRPCSLYVGELWSLIDPAGQRLLADAYHAIMADLYDDTVSERHALILAGHFAPPPPPPQAIQAPQESVAAQQARADARRQQKVREQAAQQARAADATTTKRYDPEQAKTEATAEQFGTAHDTLSENGEDIDGRTPTPSQPPNTRANSDTPDITRIPIHRHMNARRSGKRIKDPIGMKTSGAVPTHTEYLRMGGAIFKESPKPSGSILLDVSGSMSWSEEALQEAIRLAPNLIVAGYAHNSGVGAMLCVIAQGGRTSHSFPCASGGGNYGTDVPALLWLARQPEPRIIVSDGEFWTTDGIGRRNMRAWEAACKGIMRRNRITRVRTMADALSWLKRRLTPVSDGGITTPVIPQRRKH